MNNSIFFSFNISFPLLPLTSVFKLLSTSLLQSFLPAILLTPLPIHLHIESCSALLCFFFTYYLSYSDERIVLKIGHSMRIRVLAWAPAFLFQSSPLSLCSKFGVLRRRGASGPEPAQPRSARARIPPFRYESLLFSSSSTFYRLGAFISDDDSLSLRIHAPRFSVHDLLEILRHHFMNEPDFRPILVSFLFIWVTLLWG